MESADPTKFYDQLSQIVEDYSADGCDALERSLTDVLPGNQQEIASVRLVPSLLLLGLSLLSLLLSSLNTQNQAV